MQSHELLRQVFEKCSPKQISSELGLSVSLIYKWAEPPQPDAPPTGKANADRRDPAVRGAVPRRAPESRARSPSSWCTTSPWCTTM